MFLDLKNTPESFNLKLTILLSSFVIYLVFFFQTDLTQYRSVQQIWDLGHVFLFIGFSFLVIRIIFKHSEFSVYIQFAVISISAILLGMTIEYLQTFTGRDKSSYDVLLDLVGACIGFVVFSKTLLNMNRFVKVGFWVAVIILTLVSLSPMFNIVVDDIQQRKAFPVLVSNKSAREFSRFTQNNVQLDLVTNNSDQPAVKLLRMKFTQGKYSTASLGYFNQDWSSYNYLSFNVFNPISLSSLHIQIHDQLHERSGYRYRDRFNYRLRLSSGWNEIRIPLADVKKAPFKRDMNMQEIRKLMFIKVDVREPVYFFFSSIQLEK